MQKKEFKTESKKILDMMINSVYSNRDIFLRELVSNSSDAIDKLYYKSLTDDSIDINRDDFRIDIIINKEKRILSIIDNGIGMNEEELNDNLGVIAKSGSSLFKELNETDKDISIIGQFGVGFYSAFMVAKSISVKSLAYDASSAYEWNSEGADGYTISKCKKKGTGTEIVLNIKDNSSNESFDEYLEEKRIEGIIKKYSDYIKYPIYVSVDGEKNDTPVNTMIPIWKKNEKDVTKEEYNSFYSDKFYDFEEPLKVVHSKVEGQVCYDSLLFIPSHASYDYYTKEYEKGLQLYSNGVLIMDKCADLLPDYYSFVKGLVDSEDISLNISRELLQQNKDLKVISKSIEKKIKSILIEMLEENREDYEKFFDAFGTQIKYGIYSSYGVNNEELKDLLMFYSSKSKKKITLKEYLDGLGENQDKIYYACGDSIDKIDKYPIVEKYKDKELDVLYLDDYIDEFTVQSLMDYEGKKFVNVSSDADSLDTDEEKETIKNLNENEKDLLSIMKESLDDVKDVRFTNKLKNHPVCLSTEGNVSLEMEKVMNAMPNGGGIKAEVVLEINANHPIVDKLKELSSDKDELHNITKILYNQARLIEGLEVEDPVMVTNLICDMISKR